MWLTSPRVRLVKIMAVSYTSRLQWQPPPLHPGVQQIASVSERVSALSLQRPYWYLPTPAPRRQRASQGSCPQEVAEAYAAQHRVQRVLSGGCGLTTERGYSFVVELPQLNTSRLLIAMFLSKLNNSHESGGRFFLFAPAFFFFVDFLRKAL